MTTPLEKSDPEIARIIERELERQNTTIQLIASVLSVPRSLTSWPQPRNTPMRCCLSG